jgi:adenine deaminase
MINFTMQSLDEKRALIEVARGLREAELVLRQANVVSLQTNEVYTASIAISHGKIAGIGNNYKGNEEIDLKGAFLLPGFIEGHFHIESSLLHPAHLANLLVKHGTTTLIADPHEIVNVCGYKGLEFMLKATENLPLLDFYFMLPSCVPATTLETSGATFTSEDMEYVLETYGKERILGLAEVMNYPSIIHAEEELLKKLILIKEKLPKGVIDGHAPLLTGKDLGAYIASGIYSDHESISLKEVEEKLRLGMYVMLRQGSLSQNALDLAPLINPFTYKRCLLVSDDKDVVELIEKGHIDNNLRILVKEGEIDPLMAISLVTINPAEYFRLYDYGLIAPGYAADLVIVKDLSEFEVIHVIKSGKLVVKDGELLVKASAYKDESLLNTVNIAPYDLKNLVLQSTPKETKKIRVIQLILEQLITKESIEELLIDETGMVLADIQRDILYLAVIERHKASGNIGLGLVKGFGLKEGAFAASVAHDSHNIIVVGTNREDMHLAIEALKESQGGLVYTRSGEIKALLPLPIAGLLSTSPPEEVVTKLKELKETLNNAGVNIKHPTFALAFLSLAVIPEIKLTDLGLVKDFKIISPFV